MFLLTVAVTLAVAAIAASWLTWRYLGRVVAAVYYTGPPAPRPSPPLPEPWRAYPDAFLIPTTALLPFVSPAELGKAKANRDRIEARQRDMAVNGQTDPLTIVVSLNGRIALADGHHRLNAHLAAGTDRVPVRFEQVPVIPGWAASSADFVALTLPPLLAP